MATKIRRDWSKLDPAIDQLKAQGWNDTQIAKDLGIGRQTLVDHLRSRQDAGTPTAHQSTPEHFGVPQEHLDVPQTAHPRTPEHTEPPGHRDTQGHSKGTRKCWRTSPQVSLMLRISAPRNSIKVHRNTQAHP
jgi:hypothetical protein